MADRRDRDLAIDRRGADSLLCAKSMQPGRGDVIQPVDLQQGEGFEVLDHSSKRRLHPKRLQDFLQDGPGKKDILAVSQQLGQPLDSRMCGGALLAQGEGPDGSVHQDSQPRRLRSAL